MYPSPRIANVCLVVALAPFIAGCNIFSDSSTSPTTTASLTEMFSGTLTQRSSSFYTFTVAQSGTVSVTLTSVGGSSTMSVALGLGSSTGTSSCTITSANPTAVAGATPQITVTENPGTYCVQISDVGNLTAPSTFSITIVHS